MSYRKMMERELANVFGEVQKISEVDTLVFEDDQILIDRYNRRDARAIRVEAKELHKKRLNKMRSYTDWRGHRKQRGESSGKAWEFHDWNPIDTGILKNPCDPRRGRKVRAFGKKECRDYTADRFNPRLYEFRGDNTPDRVLEKYQTPELTWELEYALFPAWYDYSYEVTMKVEGEYENIYKSIKKMIEYNKILQSSKLTENLINIIDSCSDNRKW